MKLVFDLEVTVRCITEFIKCLIIIKELILEDLSNIKSVLFVCMGIKGH